MIFEILLVVNVKITISLDVLLCSLVIGTKLSEELAASMLRVGGIVAWGKNGE
jgi:hypothetical protein